MKKIIYTIVCFCLLLTSYAQRPGGIETYIPLELIKSLDATIISEKLDKGTYGFDTQLSEDFTYDILKKKVRSLMEKFSTVTISKPWTFLEEYKCYCTVYYQYDVGTIILLYYPTTKKFFIGI